MSLATFSQCYGVPGHPRGCDCAAFERFQESDEYPAWHLEQLERADEINPPTPPAVVSWWSCASRSCDALVDRPGAACDRCLDEAADAAEDARRDAYEDGDLR